MERTAFELRPSRLTIALFAGLLSLATLVFLSAVRAPSSHLLVIAGLFSPFGAIGAAMGLLQARERLVPGEPVQVTREGVLVGGALHAPGSFTHGELVTSTDVRLLRREGPALSVRFDSEQAAREAFAVLDLEERPPIRTTFAQTSLRDEDTLKQLLEWGVGGLAGLVAVFFRDWLSARFGLLLVASSLTSSVLLFRFLRSRVTLAYDGIEIRSGFQRAFLPSKEIVSVEPSAKEGSRELFVTTSDHQVTGLTFDDPERYRRHILTLMTAQASGPEFELASLARGHRTVTEWIAELRGGAGAWTPFRSVGVPVEKLWELVTDARAALTTRAAAAVALAGKPESQHRTRLARIAERSAAPKLRAIVDAATRDDDEALREVLAELDTEEAQWVRPGRGD